MAYTKADIEAYDQQVDINKRREVVRTMHHEAAYPGQGKALDQRGIEAIYTGLHQIRMAAASEHVNEWADAAWELAKQMFPL